MPVIIKEAPDRFRVLDPFYAGEWLLDREALFEYFATLDAMQLLPLDDLARFQTAAWNDVPGPAADFLRRGLPLNCDFETDKVSAAIDAIDRGIVSPPVPVVEITNTCNYHCPWCYVPGTPGERMDIDVIRTNLIVPLLSRGTRLFVLTGGEPATDIPRLEAFSTLLADEADAAGVRAEIALLTNGYRLGENAQLYRDLGITSIQVSIVSSRGAVDSRLRRAPAGCDSSEEAIAGARRAVEVGLAVSFNAVLLPALAGCPSNVEEIPAMVELAASTGAYLIRVVPVVPSGRAALAGIRLSLEELRRARQIIFEVRRQRAGQQRPIIYSPIVDDVSPGKPVYCRAGNDVLYVGADGWTYPCNNLISPEFRCWDVPLDRCSVAEIWDRSPVLLGLRHPVEVCATCTACDLRVECGGQCRAQLFWRNHQPDLARLPATCLKQGADAHERSPSGAEPEPACSANGHSQLNVSGSSCS